MKKSEGIGLVTEQIDTARYLLKGMGILCKDCDKQINAKLNEIQKNLGVVHLKVKGKTEIKKKKPTNSEPELVDPEEMEVIK